MKTGLIIWGSNLYMNLAAVVVLFEPDDVVLRNIRTYKNKLAKFM